MGERAGMAAPEAPRMSEHVYRQIVSGIVAGEFAEGTPLPAEHDLAQRFGVSRTVVREAVARLRNEGLIMSRRGAGNFVGAQPDRVVLPFAPLGSISDIERCFEFRAPIEGEAAYAAARCSDPAALARIGAALRELDKAVKERGIGAREDYGFHIAVARASKNQFFEVSLASIRSHIWMSMHIARNLSLLHSEERLATVQAEHAAIFAAISEHDPLRARFCMRQHIDNARLRVFNGTTQASDSESPAESLRG